MIKMMNDTKFTVDWTKILPAAASHKGDNGKVLVVGGSALFHAPLKWTLTVLSRLVDMVFCASTSENNDLLQAAKGGFWDGIVVPRQDLESYLHEAEVILIGPGMQRGARPATRSILKWANYSPTFEEWDNETAIIVNYLLAKYPEKRWVIDAGALQMIDPALINDNCLLTPHRVEAKNLDEVAALQEIHTLPGGRLQKGPTDQIFWQGELVAEVAGGNAGMTKGGTGDCLAGLTAGLATKIDLLSAMILSSEICKSSGDELFLQVGPFFNASDLAAQIPTSLWQLAKTQAK